MKKLILLLLLSAALISGCSAKWLGSWTGSHVAKPIPEKTSSVSSVAQPAKRTTSVMKIQAYDATIKPTATSATVNDLPSGSQAYVRLPNDQIDFDHLTIDCDVTRELITVKQGDKIVRSFPTSSGLDTIPDNTTPLGTFYIEPERGTWFYSEEYQEGAKYWVSWSGHGVFLFHSVVMDKDGNIKQDELKKLGTKASHGCFRVPLEDAKWIYDNIKAGTKVIVHD